MKFIIDIDNTICETRNSDYPNSRPWADKISIINALYDRGHTIIYWTARGATSGKDWSDLTRKQLEDWGVKCHEVIFGKPHFDVFIDDKAINAGVLDKILID